MSVKLKGITNIEVDLGINVGGELRKDAVDSVYRHMYKYIPFSGDTGKTHLNELRIETNNSITFTSSYATIQYYGSQSGVPWNYTTPGTGPYWDKKMLSAEKDDIIRELKQKYGRK